MLIGGCSAPMKGFMVHLSANGCMVRYPAMIPLRRLTFLLVCVTFVTSSRAQGLETITLRHRTAEQMLPLVQPMVEPGGAVIGAGDKLFLRTSPRNLAQVRQVIEALDRPLRRLMITVRHGGDRAGSDTQTEASVRLSPGDSRIRGRIGERNYTSHQSIAQQVQTVDGGRAYINVGQTFVLPLRQVVQTPAGIVVTDTLVQRDIGTGFQAVPRVAGDRVTLDISPANDSAGTLPGSTNVQHLTTTVSGHLGEWIALGGSVQQDSRNTTGTLQYGTRNSRDDRQVWLKVEELP